jgi:hypothetical protein
MAAPPLCARALLADLAFSAGVDASSILSGASSFRSSGVFFLAFRSGGVFFLATLSGGSSFHPSAGSGGTTAALSTTKPCGVRCFVGRCLCWFFAASCLFAGGRLAWRP